MFRVGFGFDVHQLVEGRELWLGGVNIPAAKGALGHSDADVLLHAICDAILGALALGDIGKHFPDTDNSFKNIDSKILLQQVIKLMQEGGYGLVNIDSTLCIEQPKIMPFAAEMRNVIAGICNLTINDVSIKATTSETMGFVGRQEGVTAYAVVMLQKTNL